jgi:8-oxo-dGTP diphosphatase
MIRVAVGIIRDEGKFVLVKRDEQGKFPGMWEFPGGAAPEGVTLEDALKDHLSKYFNLDVVVQDKLASVTQEYDFGTVEVTAFGVECISKKVRLAHHLSYRWVRWNQFKEFDCVPSITPMLEILKSQGL